MAQVLPSFPSFRQVFFHHDSRLGRDRRAHPIVVKSVDATSDFPNASAAEIRFNYGYSGTQRDRQLYVEVAIRNPRPGIFWICECFDVKILLNSALPPPEVCRFARLIGIKKAARLVEKIIDHAAWKRTERMEALGDYHQEFGDDASFKSLFGSRAKSLSS